MRPILAAVLTLSLCGPAAAREKRLTREEVAEYSKRESWHTMNMEATAIMGELKYQRGDLEEARDTFRDSLNSSTKIMAPGSTVMGLDLYRSAELAARKGDFSTARQDLEILLSRYPETEFARKGADLLSLLPKKHGDEDDDEAATPIMSAEQPEFVLARIQASLKAGKDEEALSDCREFADRYPEHKAAGEVRTTAAALYLKLGSPDRAAAILKALIAKSADAELRARAIHLLGAADAALGDYADILAAVPAAAPAKAWSPWIARAQLWRAAALDDSGLRSDAAALYSALVKADLRSPVKAFALAGLAADEEKLGRLERAQHDLARAADEADRWELADVASASRLSIAHLLYRRRRFSAAAAAYEAFVARYPQDPLKGQALFQQGLALKRLSKPHEAVASFTRLLQEVPDSAYAADAHLQLGQLYDGLGAHSAAIAQYEEMGRTGDKAEAKESILLRAQVHYNAKRFKSAIPLYWQFLDQDPNDARAREVQDLLLTSYWLGDRDDPGLAKAVSLYPDHAIIKHIRWELAVRAYQRKDFQKAEELFSLYAADFPKSPHAAECLFFQGESLMKMGDSQGAASAYQALLARFPKYEKAREASLRLAAALYTAKDFEGSAQAYGRVARGKDPAAADALYSRALSLLKAVDDEGALAAFEQFLARFPRDRRVSAAWHEVGRLREESGRLSQAAFAYAHVPPGDPRRIDALFSAARLREKLKQTALAVRNYEALKAARPAANPLRLRGLLRLGLLYELNGRPAKAMSLYGEIMRLAPHDGKDYGAARQRVESLTARGLLTRS